VPLASLLEFVLPNGNYGNPRDRVPSKTMLIEIGRAQFHCGIRARYQTTTPGRWTDRLLRRLPRTAMVRAATDLELQALSCEPSLPVVTGFPLCAREAGTEVGGMLDRFGSPEPPDDQIGPRH
jgi:hypothetical protein